ncbi:MAG TPA: FAD-dependent oxidoreductase [Devosia sp.]|nr:FAD-dependent oxidoreductase [Devosia sp.]
MNHHDHRAAGEGLAADRPSRVSRREFFKKATAGAAGVALGVTVVSSAEAQEWDETTDVVVVGSGGAALAGAAGALMGGAKVSIYEKGPVAGGTTAKSGGQYWIPNSHFMQAAGLADPKEDALKYMARLAFPTLYRAADAKLGLSDHAYGMLSAYYDNGSKVIKTLHDEGALLSILAPTYDGGPTPDYFAHIEEDKANHGRTTSPQSPDGKPGYGGDIIRMLGAYAEAKGSPIITDTQVSKIVLDDNRAVVGVEITDANGTKMIRANKGVIFGSGGFTQNPEMRQNYLRVPVLGGCAVPTNQGDLVNLSIEIGAKLGNMNEAWHQQEILEEVLEFSSVPSGVWFLGGDSMIAVNKYGFRLYDEKFVYNERTRTHLTWNAVKSEYSNYFQFMIFDDAAIAKGGMMMPPAGADMPAYIIKGDTLEALATAIDDRLASLEDRISHFRLDSTWVAQTKATIERFNGFAETGKDLDFNRGEQPIDNHFHGPSDNNHMAPMTTTGPYYAIILAPGTLDTKGGPVTDEMGRVVDTKDKVIDGLYAAGNCSASIAGQAYWGAGGTLGPAITFGFLAGQHAAARA